MLSLRLIYHSDKRFVSSTVITLVHRGLVPAKRYLLEIRLELTRQMKNLGNRHSFFFLKASDGIIDVVGQCVEEKNRPIC